MAYTVDDFRTEIEQYHTEIEFRYAGEHYYVSDNFFAEDGSTPGILIKGPDNDEFVQSVDEALDKLIVGGKPLREMIGKIELT